MPGIILALCAFGALIAFSEDGGDEPIGCCFAAVLLAAGLGLAGVGINSFVAGCH
ncbi:hypothetical protein AB0D56_38325 [Streptomyces sp. NPDC048209]|uniref:hypothetical protein n=1 Tax=Streptomycetaceae TaxID=2062 RepID=UPI00343F66F9